VNYTYLMDFTEVKFGAEDDKVGETAFAEHEWQVGLGYNLGAWTAQWEWVYIDDSVPDNSSEFFREFDVGSYSVHDLFVSFDLGASGLLGDVLAEGTSVYLGVNNVFDEDAPIILTGVPGNSTGTDTDASVYNPIGRTYFAGLRVKF
jgi:outer membrane receptor protein involved in Fe transport